jgi:hypothetical protein
MLTREPTWTTRELVTELGLSRQTIQRYARVYRIGHRGAYRCHRFTRADIAALEAKLTEMVVTGRPRRMNGPGRIAPQSAPADPNANVPRSSDDATTAAEIAELL